MSGKARRGCCTCCDQSLGRAVAWVQAQEAGRPLGEHAHPAKGCLCAWRLPAERCGCGWCARVMGSRPRCKRRGCEEPQASSWEAMCASHRAEARAREDATRARAREVRTPPRPPYDDAPDGVCRLCGTEDLEPRRIRWCSQACVDTWLWASTPAAAIAHLTKLHGAVCWGCGQTHRATLGWDGEPFQAQLALELEHRRPLWSLTPAEREELRWWLPFNLQLLCTECHRTKTKAEAGERAALRRAARVDADR